MEPFEIMISESQERMLCVVEPQRLDEVLAVCERWEMRATPIGEVTDTRRAADASTATSSSATCRSTALVDDCPLYDLEPERADASRSIRAPPAPARRRTPAPRRRCSRCSARPTSPRKRWRVRAVRLARRLAHGAPPEAGRRRRAARSRADGGTRRRSPSRSTATAGASPATRTSGAAEAVLECAANLACVGAEPLGLTNCLNFGNPEKPHIAWQLTEAVEGMARRLPRARRAGRRRQRLALQRGRRGADLPDAGRRHGRRAARPGARRRAARLRARRADAIALVGPVRAVAARAPSSRSCAARLADELPDVDLARSAERARRRPRRGPRRRPAQRARRLRGRPRRARSPSAAIAGGVGRAGRPRAADARGVERPRSSARARAASSSPGPREAIDGARRQSRRHGLRSRSAGGRRRRSDRGPRCYDRRCRSSDARDGASTQALASAGASPCLIEPQRAPSTHDPRRAARRVRRLRRLRARSDVARLAYFALYALQHRGQESAGIATCEDGHIMTAARPRARLQVFDEQKLQRAHRADGRSATCATRPPARRLGERPAGLPPRPPPGRAGAQRQPDQRRRAPRRADASRASPSARTSDSEIIAALLSSMPAEHDRGRGRRGHAAPRGRLLDGRDDRGPRGRLPRPGRPAPALRSGSSATATASPPRAARFDIIGAELLREVAARRADLARRARHRDAPGGRVASGTAFCVFEHIYFARPDSILEGNRTQVVAPQDGRDPRARGARRGRPRDRRARLGQRRRRRATRAASGHPADDGLIKNRYVGAHLHPARPGAAQARPADEVQPAARGGRGQAPGGRRRLDRARQHHAPDRRRCCATPARPRSTCASPRRRSATPATTASTCRRREEMIAHGRTVEEIAEELGCDSLAYLSLDGVYEAIRGTRDDALRRLLLGRVPAGADRVPRTASSRSRSCPSCRS